MILIGQGDLNIARWGVVAIALTRPVPILAETVAILAGSSRLRWRDAAVYALTGAYVAPPRITR